MVRTSTKKKVNTDFWRGRHSAAQSYRKFAEDGFQLADKGDNLNPVVSQIVLAAIAYADTLTAKRHQVVNQQDHQAAPSLLREVMGNALLDVQHKQYTRILGNKDSAQYGARQIRREKVIELLDDLRSFGNWVESQL
ncbi:MAG: hypothetical protein JWR22_4255 [Herminiimonas sp.]|nr:hypothetical protein [Herminiimonas sp.]